LARFARDLTRLSGEIIAENFSAKTIAAMAQMDQIDPQVFALLATDRARGMSIEIETDSTIQPDEDAEKQRRIEFTTAIGGLFQQAAPIVMQAPQLGPFIGEVLKFTAQGFRAGRPLEGAIDQLTQQLQQMAQAAMQPKPPPPPDPTQVAKLQTEQVKGQAAVAKAQADGQATQIKGQVDQAKANATMQQTQMKMKESVLDHQLTMQEMAARAANPEPEKRPN
jgi:hypothetical protein